MSLPLDGYAFKARRFKSLSAHPADWLTIGPITLFVGRNNTGKSSVIDALKVILTGKEAFNSAFNQHGGSATFEIQFRLEEQHLKFVFQSHTSGGNIAMNHWQYAQRHIGSLVSVIVDPNWNLSWGDRPDFTDINSPDLYERQVLEHVRPPTMCVIHIGAERNVRPEPHSPLAPVDPFGRNLTNVIRAFLYDASLPMEEVEVGLLSDLNEIYAGDFEFSRIICQEESGNWEIYLQEANSTSAVRLSQSGSSLKSIFIILATLRLNPLIERRFTVAGAVYCIEEPENNLHPSLLRRLLNYLARFSEKNRSHLIITSHSSAAIDWVSRRANSYIYHVANSKGGVVIHRAVDNLQMHNLIDDLDIRASELLQANFVVWVEGPSDRIYIRRWIDLQSEGALKEGIHYSIMFYGGKLLSHLSVLDQDQIGEAISLLRINRKLAVIMDSDRKQTRGGGFRSNLNATKKRIITEADSVGGMSWVTKGREIENYIHNDILNSMVGRNCSVGEFDNVPDLLRGVGDKITIAHEVASRTCLEHLAVLDLGQRMQDLVRRIGLSNGLEF